MTGSMVGIVDPNYRHRHSSSARSITSRVLLPLACTIVCLLFAASAPAQYRFDSWTTDNGLPENSVNSIVQTADGYLWLATFGGLVRYDGMNFKVFTPGNTSGLTTRPRESPIRCRTSFQLVHLPKFRPFDCPTKPASKCLVGKERIC